MKKELCSGLFGIEYDEKGKIIELAEYNTTGYPVGGHYPIKTIKVGEKVTAKQFLADGKVLVRSGTEGEVISILKPTYIDARVEVLFDGQTETICPRIDVVDSSH